MKHTSTRVCVWCGSVDGGLDGWIVQLPWSTLMDVVESWEFLSELLAICDAEDSHPATPVRTPDTTPTRRYTLPPSLSVSSEWLVRPHNHLQKEDYERNRHKTADRDNNSDSSHRQCRQRHLPRQPPQQVALLPWERQRRALLRPPEQL